MKEGSEPKAQPSSQTMLNRIVELEDELGVCKAGMERNKQCVEDLAVLVHQSAVDQDPGCPSCGNRTVKIVMATTGPQYVCAGCGAVRYE